MNIYRDELNKNDIIEHIRGQKLPLQYTGWNNGHIWEFYEMKFKNEEDIDGFFSKEMTYLTAMELKDWKKYTTY